MVQQDANDGARMTEHQERASEIAAERAAQAPLSRRELALILAFWTSIALLSAANRYLDPRGGGFQISWSSAPLTIAFVESYTWALLTPLIFRLATRFNFDRGRRVQSLLVFIVIGIVVAAAMAVGMDELRSAILPPRPRRDRPEPSIWDITRLRSLNNLIIYFAVLAAGLARDYSLRYRARREEAVRLQAESARLQAQLAEARLDGLRRQLDPHFLFNTLHAVSSLVERDPRGVRRMISRLSDLLRHSMESSGEQEIALREEFALLQRYVDIMQVRFQGRLEVIIDADDAVLDALVPNLVLQPLVENAIKHGVNKVEGQGRIRVDAVLDGDQLVLRVRDNGPGPATPGDQVASSGVGLQNTMERLQQLYGGKQRFSLHPASDGEPGTVAEVLIPYHTRGDAEAALPRVRAALG